MNGYKAIEVFVLSGGKSSRMGQDKGLALFHNKPMITYLLDALDKLNLSIKIVANSEEYNTLGYTIVKDVVPEKGPIGGLFTAFHYTQAEFVFLISCDMPFITPEIISKIIAEVDNHEVTVATIQNKINPLFAIYNTSLKKLVEKRIADGNLKMQQLIHSVYSKSVKMDEYLVLQPNLFMNMNFNSDIKNLEHNGTKPN